MYVVEVVFRVGPVKRGIIDFELEIRRNPGRLRGGDVGADDGSVGKLVGEIDGPDSWRVLGPGMTQ
jgi:hypothetical protein